MFFCHHLLNTSLVCQRLHTIRNCCLVLSQLLVSQLLDTHVHVHTIMRDSLPVICNMVSSLLLLQYTVAIPVVGEHSITGGVQRK